MNPEDFLPPNTQLLGTAKCVEAEPQCVSVGVTDDGDLVLANHLGQQFTIPAGEIDQVLELVARR